MASKPTVKLPSKWIERSKEYAKDVVARYARGENAASRAVSSHGAESNVELQSHARMAECAACFHFGVDPDTSLNWTGRCDSGWDLIAYGARWDVKATLTGQYLIWPINKRDIFPTKRFDAFVLVRGVAPWFVILGHIPKIIFAHDHHIAGNGHLLDAGTWYMHESELWP